MVDPIDKNPQLPLLEDVVERAAFVVRESHRAKRLSVRVFPHGRVEVVVLNSIFSAACRGAGTVRRTALRFGCLAVPVPPVCFAVDCLARVASAGPGENCLLWLRMPCSS